MNRKLRKTLNEQEVKLGHKISAIAFNQFMSTFY